MEARCLRMDAQDPGRLAPANWDVPAELDREPARTAARGLVDQRPNGGQGAIQPLDFESRVAIGLPLPAAGYQESPRRWSEDEDQDEQRHSAANVHGIVAGDGCPRSDHSGW